MWGALLAVALSVAGLAGAEAGGNARYVDPFIGTGGAGNTFPGAVVPWGMVSVSPHTDLASPSGYHYGRPHLYGFGHVHLSGTGCPDLGNILLMPTTGPLQTAEDAYKSAFTGESAEPGYYKVDLTTYGVRAEMTATARAGLSRYTFPACAGDARILVDVSHGLTECRAAQVTIVSPTEVEGWNVSGNFCSAGNRQAVYFVAQLSKPASAFGTWNGAGAGREGEQYGTDVGAYCEFTTAQGEAVLVRVGISYVSIANARLNLQAEIPDWDFERARRAAFDEWDRELSRVEVEGGTRQQRTAFYTALYHVLIHPSIFSDVNGEYVTMGRAGTRRAEGYTRYHVYSLWDTYRNVHPFLTLVYPERQLDMVKTMVEQYRESGWLPKWELAANETYVMVGDPAVTVIADTYVKGLRGFDAEAAYEAALKGATAKENNPLRRELAEYLERGYVPFKALGWDAGAASITLEYCHQDWALAQMAAALGREGERQALTKRASFYSNLYDEQTGFLRARRRDGSYLEPFDPVHGWRGYTEGNAWQYAFFVPHDPAGLASLMGGQDRFVSRLQECFDRGQFVLWNEPDMAYPYLFTYMNAEAWRTQREVRAALSRHFGASPDGVPGNDDAGATSAWYVFSAMGFYPACPGSTLYQVGSPLFDSVTIRLNPAFYPGERFVVKAQGNGPDSVYVQSAALDGRPYERPHLDHGDLVKGGTLVLTMGPGPSCWGGVPVVPRIAEEPADVEAVEGQAAVFRARAAGSGPVRLAWQRQGQDIPGGTMPELTIPAVSLEDDGARFRLMASSPAGRASSREAVLHVQPDRTPPELLAVESRRDRTDWLRLIFSEPLAPSAAQPDRYAVSGGVAVLGAVLEEDGRTVRLSTSAMSPEVAYVVTVRGVQDRAGVPNVLAEADRTREPPGDGLAAEYFDNLDLAGEPVRCVDAEVSFRWGGGSPDPRIGPDTFSARWTGWVRPPLSGTYTFLTRSDDGMRVWVDGRRTVESWWDQSGAEDAAGSVWLEAGRCYAVKVEYYENAGLAVAELRWSAPGMPERIVPQCCLFSALPEGAQAGEPR